MTAHVSVDMETSHPCTFWRILNLFIVWLLEKTEEKGQVLCGDFVHRRAAAVAA